MGVHKAACARVSLAGLQWALAGIVQRAAVHSCAHVQMQWACAARRAGRPGEESSQGWIVCARKHDGVSSSGHAGRLTRLERGDAPSGSCVRVPRSMGGRGSEGTGAGSVGMRACIGAPKKESLLYI